MSVARAATGPLSALRYPEFRAFFSGMLAANVGNWMQQFSLGWLVVQIAVRDGNPALGALYLGLVGLSRAAPAIVFGLLGGVFADRMDRRRVLLLSRWASTAIGALLAAMVLSDRASIAGVMVLSFLSAATFGFDAPARQAIVSHLVAPVDLFSALGLVRGTQQSSTLFGPLVGGALIGPIGVGGVMVVNTVLFLVSVAALVPMQPRPASAAAASQGVLVAMREGIAFARHDSLVGSLTLLTGFFAFLVLPPVFLLPALAHDTLGVGAIELSWLTGAAGLGALIGTVIAASAGGVERRGWLLLGTLMLTGALLALVGLQRDLVATMAALALFGCAQQVFVGTHVTIIQLVIPDHLRGRVIGLQPVFVLGGGPLGTLLVGALGAAIGVSNVLVLAGAVVAVGAGLIFLWVRPIREVRGDQPA